MSKVSGLHLIAVVHSSILHIRMRVRVRAHAIGQGQSSPFRIFGQFNTFVLSDIVLGLRWEILYFCWGPQLNCGFGMELDSLAEPSGRTKTLNPLNPKL